jgi:hypothetical protein
MNPLTKEQFISEKTNTLNVKTFFVPGNLKEAVSFSKSLHPEAFLKGLNGLIDQSYDLLYLIAVNYKKLLEVKKTIPKEEIFELTPDMILETIDEIKKRVFIPVSPLNLKEKSRTAVLVDNIEDEKYSNFSELYKSGNTCVYKTIDDKGIPSYKEISNDCVLSLEEKNLQKIGRLDKENSTYYIDTTNPLGDINITSDVVMTDSNTLVIGETFADAGVVTITGINQEDKSFTCQVIIGHQNCDIAADVFNNIKKQYGKIKDINIKVGPYAKSPSYYVGTDVKDKFIKKNIEYTTYFNEICLNKLNAKDKENYKNKNIDDKVGFNFIELFINDLRKEISNFNSAKSANESINYEVNHDNSSDLLSDFNKTNDDQRSENNNNDDRNIKYSSVRDVQYGFYKKIYNLKSEIEDNNLSQEKQSETFKTIFEEIKSYSEFRMHNKDFEKEFLSLKEKYEKIVEKIVYENHNDQIEAKNLINIFENFTLKHLNSCVPRNIAFSVINNNKIKISP